MKVFRKLALGLLLVVAASMAGASKVMAQARMYGSSSFYNDLAPYGRWINYKQYGEAWIPDVESGFQPYATRGHWIVTEYGNTWVSDYDWGWAPFHYGRWTFDDYYGWIWLPGDEWGPAWVSWRSDNDYYGWAPLGPGVDINININIPLSRWVFVPKRYITNRYVHNYCLPPPRVVHIYRNTRVLNNCYVYNNRRYVTGPYRDEIERETRGKVIVHRIDNSDRPSRSSYTNDSFRTYRPEITGRPQRSSDDYRTRSNQYNPGNRDYSRDNDDKSSNGTTRPSWENRNARNNGNNNSRGQGDKTAEERINRPRPNRSGTEQSQQPANEAPQTRGSTQRSAPEPSRSYERPQRNANPGNSETRTQSDQRSERGSNNGSGQSNSGRSRPVRGI